MLRQQVFTVAMAAIATCFIHSTARAQGTCGAAGGAPPGPAYSVCDFAKEAAGLPADGPALGVGNPIDLATGNKYRHDQAAIGLGWGLGFGVGACLGLGSGLHVAAPVAVATSLPW